MPVYCMSNLVVKKIFYILQEKIMNNKIKIYILIYSLFLFCGKRTLVTVSYQKRLVKLILL